MSSVKRTGPLVVLIDRRTGSTAADVASHLHAFEDAVLIGEETTGAYNGNSSGYLDRNDLTHSGLAVYLPRWRYETAAYSSANRHRGVLPDIPIGPAPEDIETRSDRVMEAALALIGAR